MTTQLPLKTDYQAVRAQLEQAFSKNLAEVEEQALAQLPNKEVADEIRGSYVKDTAALVSLFTPDYFAGCVEAFDGDPASHDFLDFCVQELNENLAYLALVAWPNAIGREYAWSALSFPISQRWGDKVSFNEEEGPKAETAPPVPTPMTLEYLVEVFSNQYDKTQVEGFVELLGLDRCAQMAEAHAGLRYNGIEFSEEEPMTFEDLVEAFSDKYDREQVEAWVEEFGFGEIEELAEAHLHTKERVKAKDPYFLELYKEDIKPMSFLVKQFEGQFSQEEAEAISAGFDGDVKRASSLYEHLTDGYASHMTVEDLIKAGKE